MHPASYFILLISSFRFYSYFAQIKFFICIIYYLPVISVFLHGLSPGLDFLENQVLVMRNLLFFFF